MPQGYYTIEQWTRPRAGNKSLQQWVAIAHLPFGASLTQAEEALAQRNEPGFYRLVHTQRIIWAQRDGQSLRLRKSHAGSPENLAVVQRMFDRCGGEYPIDEITAARARKKAQRSRARAGRACRAGRNTSG